MLHANCSRDLNKRQGPLIKVQQSHAAQGQDSLCCAKKKKQNEGKAAYVLNLSDAFDKFFGHSFSCTFFFLV